MKSVLSLALIVPALAAFSVTSTAEPRERPVSGEGEPCDGFVVHPRMCAEGLICSRRGMDPADEGPGICVREAPYGQSCGGSVRGAANCAEGHESHTAHGDL